MTTTKTKRNATVPATELDLGSHTLRLNPITIRRNDDGTVTVRMSHQMATELFADAESHEAHLAHRFHSGEQSISVSREDRLEIARACDARSAHYKAARIASESVNPWA